MFLQIYIQHQVVQIQIKRNMVSETCTVVSKNVCIFHLSLTSSSVLAYFSVAKFQILVGSLTKKALVFANSWPDGIYSN